MPNFDVPSSELKLYPVLCFMLHKQRVGNVLPLKTLSTIWYGNVINY